MDKIRKLFRRVSRSISLSGSKSLKSILERDLENGITILKRKGYKYESILGKGAYGTIIKVAAPNRKDEVAAKIISRNRTHTAEMYTWRLFDHPNILRLLAHIREPRIDIFLMPCHPHTLYDYTMKDNLRFHSRKFQISRNWLNNILSGLLYLHEMNICHFDLKLDNVLITANMTAVICDFSVVNVADEKISRFGVTPYCRPPEACISYGKGQKLFGIPFDMWTFGMVSFTVLTGINIDRMTDDKQLHLHAWIGPRAKINYWPTLVYPHLFEALKPSAFRTQMRSTFRNMRVEDSMMSKALNFVQGILMHHPTDRPNASKVLRHAFFSDFRNAEFLPVDSIWICRMNVIDEPITRDPKLEEFAVLEDFTEMEMEQNPDSDPETPSNDTAFLKRAAKIQDLSQI